MDKYIGKRLDARYEIQELIGVGGMAVVYRAYDTIEDKIVAIKILKDEFLGNKEFIRRFKTESKAIAVLSDQNIVKVYDVSFGTKIQYIVMEYIDGITLKEYISRQKIIQWKEAVYFAVQILNALKHAHSKGVIHRDIKPQNIMLLKDGTIKVTDFGIARFSKNDTQTMTDRAIGSVHYIAPEQAKGGVTDEKADIYSVGVIMYEMLTGKLPFEADNAVSVAIMQMQTRPKPLTEINNSIPKGLEQITLHAMEKDPINRYNSAEDMIVDIEMFKNDPDIRFEYKYFVDDNPTKYVDAINNVRASSRSYDDGFDYKDEVEQKKKSKAILIVGGIAAAVGIISIILILINIFRPFFDDTVKDIDVPNFVGMKLEDVQNNLDYKFVWKVESVYDANKLEGVIIDQDPVANSKKVKEGSTIVLKVNSGGVLVTIPAVSGLSEEVAKTKLTNAGIKFETLMIVDDDTAAGIVKNSDPQEGSKITADTTVRLYVSKGPAEKKVTVPDVIGMSLTEAKKNLIDKGLKISDNITYEDSEKSKDVVLSTDPLPNVSVGVGASIKIIVSNGVKQDKELEINVDLPKHVKNEVTITTYINGILDSTKKVVPAYTEVYPITIKGKSGKKTINVDIDGQQYRVYEVNFDEASNNIKKVSTFDYLPKSTIADSNKSTDSNSNSNKNLSEDANTSSSNSDGNSTN